MRLYRCVYVLALAVLSTTNARANLLTNGDFGTGSDPGAGMRVLAGSTAIFGWTVLSTDVDYVSSNWWQSAPGTTRTVDLAGFQPGGIEQVVPTIAGETYTLSFYLAGNVDGGPAIKFLDVLARYNNSTFASASFSFDSTGYSHANMGWAQQTWQFTALGASTTLRLVDTDYSGMQPATSGLPWNAFGPVVGNLVLTQDDDPPPEDTPEPISFALLGAGLIGVACLYRRRASR